MNKKTDNEKTGAEVKKGASSEKKAVPPKKKKKKLLRTPSHMIRITMIWVYVLIIFMMTSPFITASFYITEDLNITTNRSEAYLFYSTQEEVDTSAKNMQKALDGLKDKPVEADELDEYQEEVLSVPTARYDWQYHPDEGVDAKELISLIEEGRNVDRRLYTDESVKALNQAMLEAQKTLCATVTITRSELELMFDGNVNGADNGEIGGLVTSVLLIYMLVFLPVIGFFITVFNKKGHTKNVYGLICSVGCLSIIMLMVYPFVALGAVFTIVAYIILFFLTGAGFYAKQQEDYIVKHPELETEFTEKHPWFVRALINYKAVNMPVTLTEKDKAYASAQNAKKHGRSRK